MKKLLCSCGSWGLSGIPSTHSIVAIHKKDFDPLDFVDEQYSISSFKKIYENVLYPINGEAQWPEADGVKLEAPVSYKQLGRPKKARRKQFGELNGNTKRIRRRNVIHCKNCGQDGQNNRGCRNGSASSKKSGCNPGQQVGHSHGQERQDAQVSSQETRSTKKTQQRINATRQSTRENRTHGHTRV